MLTIVRFFLHTSSLLPCRIVISYLALPAILLSPSLYLPARMISNTSPRQYCDQTKTSDLCMNPVVLKLAWLADNRMPCVVFTVTGYICAT